jgi:hypothetical protein
MKARLTLAVCTAAIAAGALAPAADARVAPERIRTIPPVPHARFIIDGKTVMTDSKGRIDVHLPGVRTERYRFHIHPQDKRLGPNKIAKFARWYGHNTVTYELNYRMRWSFHNLARQPVSPDLVTAMSLKSRTGVRTPVKQGAPVWLRGSRVVPFSGQLVSKDIDYQVESALVDGTNVVNRAQQRFTPSKTQRLDVRLLFYSLKVKTKDALFGFPVGSAVQLTYPSGRVVRAPLKDGEVRLPSLPRGTYDLKVVASGISFTRPVSVSRNQEVELKVISYLDIVLAGLALLALAVGLLIVRRPHLLARLRRRGRVTAGVGSE